jgi:hypothetical protein
VTDVGRVAFTRLWNSPGKKRKKSNGWRRCNKGFWFRNSQDILHWKGSSLLHGTANHRPSCWIKALAKASTLDIKATGWLQNSTKLG